MEALVDDAQKLYEATKASTHTAALGVCNLLEEDGDNDRDINAVYKKETANQREQDMAKPGTVFLP